MTYYGSDCCKECDRLAEYAGSIFYQMKKFDEE